ncbi:MAG: hypothetical protein LQ342_006958 [Letrouitia transgressa]|nr:MAG: hypothetical protein LQ342_006958 [Letrouitia transgressa]
MDLAAKGAQALASKDFTAAVTHYTNAIASNPQAINYYIQRSIAYTRVSPVDHASALRDAEMALMLASKRGKRELIAQAQLRRAVALFSLERYGDAKQCLEWARKLDEKEKTIEIWEMKVKGKLKVLEEFDGKAQIHVAELPDVEMPIVQEKNRAKAQSDIEEKTKQELATSENGVAAKSAEVTSQGAQTPSNKIRHEWYQTSDNVIVALFAKGIPKDKAQVDIQSTSLSISFPLSTGADFDLSFDPLYAKIDPTKSSHKITSVKAEFILKKAASGEQWPSLEGTEQKLANGRTHALEEPATAAASQFQSKPATAPAYPTSSKSGPKDWDKLASDLTKKPKKSKEKGKDGESANDNDDGEFDDFEGADPVNGFFQSIYKNADPDTRRAMMKSFTESNGTALSTNWSEVGKGKVETSPPDGMEAKPW